jgi:3-phenylpropionate/trans-cinnamate dioxygenase ferredoxin component
MQAGGEGFVDVLALADLPEGGQRTVLLGFQRVLLCRSAHGLYAVAGLCPHAFQPLEGGEIRDQSIRCRKHGACFDLSTGAPLNGVTNQRLRTYTVRVRDGRIEIQGLFSR